MQTSENGLWPISKIFKFFQFGKIQHLSQSQRLNIFKINDEPFVLAEAASKNSSIWFHIDMEHSDFVPLRPALHDNLLVFYLLVFYLKLLFTGFENKLFQFSSCILNLNVDRLAANGPMGKVATKQIQSINV